MNNTNSRSLASRSEARRPTREADKWILLKSISPIGAICFLFWVALLCLCLFSCAHTNSLKPPIPVWGDQGLIYEPKCSWDPSRIPLQIGHNGGKFIDGACRWVNTEVGFKIVSCVDEPYDEEKHDVYIWKDSDRLEALMGGYAIGVTSIARVSCVPVYADIVVGRLEFYLVEHEIFHALGLDDDYLPSSIMNRRQWNIHQSMPSLTEFDRWILRLLYGAEED